MESPQLYDTNDYKKHGSNNNVKVKSNIFHEDLGAEFANELNSPENFIDIDRYLDETTGGDHSNLIQGFEDLNVNRSASVVAAAAALSPSGGSRALNGNAASLSLAANNIYGSIAYLPQPVHGSHYDRPYHDRLGIKEEPELNRGATDFSSCGARVAGYGYPTSIPNNYSVPAGILGTDAMLKSPLKSPSGGMMKPGGKTKHMEKGTDEYKRRRERNNIAVRKSREKAKARTKETEEKVKVLSRENDKLQKKCDVLSKEVDFFRKIFSNGNLQQLPEHIQQQYHQQLAQLRYNQQMISM